VPYETCLLFSFIESNEWSVTENITIQEVVLQIYSPDQIIAWSDLPIVLYSSGDHLGVERTIPVKYFALDHRY